MNVARRLRGIVAVGLFLSTIVSTTTAKYSGGTGEPNDPYQIATAADLFVLGETPADYDKHFLLTADIDLDPNLPGRKVFDKAVIAPDTNDTEDGFQGPRFAGSFDGNDHTILHLTIEGGGYVGLFGELASGAEVKALGVANVSVTGSDPYVGGLVGYNYGTILTSHSTGMVQGGGGVGGLVGNNDGTITSSHSSATVSGTHCDLCGGLVGINDRGSIAACYSTGTVSGHQQIGGLAGGNAFGCIVMSYSRGAVTGDGLVGGLVGLSPGNITASFWDKETSGQLQSAGGTGLTTAEMQDINTFLREGWDFVGESSNGTCDYWQMSPGDYPRLRYLTGEEPLMPQGLGTPEHPYLIRDARDLGTVWFKPRARYRLEASVDLSETMWSMAVVPQFAGTLDGNGHVIRDLHVRGAGSLGLFGELLSDAKILNLSLEAVDITGTSDGVGGLAGRSEGSITLCRSTGKVTGRAWVGVLLGLNEGDITTSYSAGTASGEVVVGGLAGWNSGRVATSHSATAVRGELFAGGLVGGNYPPGNIIMSYSSGTVTGDAEVGGLVGFSRSSSIAMSYSTGTITALGSMGGLVGINIDSSITSSFWDTQTSGRATSNGGIGKTTAEMQTGKTFLDAGWDFVGETANGTEDIWWIDEGKDYPRLWWEAAGDSDS